MNTDSNNLNFNGAEEAAEPTVTSENEHGDNPTQCGDNGTFTTESVTEEQFERTPGGDEATVRFDTVSRPVDHNSNTGLKVFFSMIAVIVALIIAVSAGYVFANNQQQNGKHYYTPTTSTVGKTDSEYQSEKTAVFANVNPSVVGITVYSGSTASGYASGVIYTSDGYIVTNDHIYSDVASAQFLVTLYDGTTYKAEFIAGDTRSDLAVLKIEATGLKQAVFGDYSEVTAGEEVISIGYPQGITAGPILTSGTVSASGVRFRSTSSYSVKMIQTDAPINPGNSGGALVNMYSQVIGIPSVKVTGYTYDNVGYAIPSSTVVTVADSLIKYGYVEGRGRLGISYLEIDAITAQIQGTPAGLMVKEITDDSDLNNKGIKEGDIITHINDVKITSGDVALDIIESTKAGVSMSFTVYHASDKSSDTVYASLLPDPGNSSYTNKVTSESSKDNPFGNDGDDFFSDH